MPEPVCTAPVTRYARAGTFHIACQIVGTGTPDVVFVPAFWSHLDSAD